MTIPDTDEEELNREPGTEKDQGNQIRWRSPMVFSIVGIIVIILVAGGVYLKAVRQHTPSEPVASATVTGQVVDEGSPMAWSRFTSTAVGVLLQHPKDWYPHEVTTPSGAIEIIMTAPVDSPNPQTTAPGETLTFQIWRIENNSSETLESWAVKELEGPNPDGPAARQYLTIDGQLALQLQYYDQPSSLTAVDVDQYRYFIAAQSLSAPYANYKNLFQEVTTSIHFTQ